MNEFPWAWCTKVNLLIIKQRRFHMVLIKNEKRGKLVPRQAILSYSYYNNRITNQLAKLLKLVDGGGVYYCFAAARVKYSNRAACWSLAISCRSSQTWIQKIIECWYNYWMRVRLSSDPDRAVNFYLNSSESGIF